MIPQARKLCLFILDFIRELNRDAIFYSVSFHFNSFVYIPVGIILSDVT